MCRLQAVRPRSGARRGGFRTFRGFRKFHGLRGLRRALVMHPASRQYNGTCHIAVEDGCG
ncbi:hypothetical protein GCM10009612_04400 [Streptomyces beijiangensis]